jgi:cation diffusion facilitator CzcD-associated flavoprotein CzcO
MSLGVETDSGALTDGDADFGAVVVGAGFGGLRMLYELRQLGVTAKVIEAGADVGGTWFWNRYPGARTDSESWVYCYSFSRELERDWNWAERYPAQPEVLRYLQHVADRFDLRRDIQFDTRVESAVYDEAANLWVITTDGGETFTCKYFIPATGPLSRPIDPPFEGLESFEGEWYLTARWPERDVDLTGKRVGVIGTGATGVQVVPVIAPVAAEVTVFQRTPNFVMAAGNRALTDAERDAIKDRYESIWARTQQQAGGFAMNDAPQAVSETDPAQQQRVFEEVWDAGGFQFLFETFNDIMLDDRSNEAAAEFIRSKIRSIVTDPITAELLCPKGYPLGAKRPPLGHSYFEAFNRDNVTLVDVSDDPIERITPRGVRTGTEEHELDVIIFATGFDASTGALMAMDIRGNNGESLNDKWAQGPRTYLGVAVDGFPNMFMISGPQSPFANIPVIIENAVRFISRAVSDQERQQLASLEARTAAVQGWVDETESILNKSLVGRGENVRSWFLGANIEGKPHGAFFFHGAANTYFDRLRDEADQGFAGFVAQPSKPAAGRSTPHPVGDPHSAAGITDRTKASLT